MRVIGAFGLVVLAGSALGVELDPVVSFPSQLAAAASVGEAVAWDAQDGAKPAEAAQPKPELSFWSGWKRNVDVGLNGASGNSENLSVRGLVGAERKSDTMETKASISYVYATDDGNKSKSRGEANLFNNWLFGADSKWGWFAQGKIEFDEIQNWKWRFSGATGPSYMFIKEEKTTLRGRAGLGAFYETGKTADEELHPELDLGVDFNHTFSEGQKFFAVVDYYPSLDEFPAYRIVSQAGFEFMLSKENSMTLKLGVQDRYDSTPGVGFKRNDVEYFVTLGFNF